MSLIDETVDDIAADMRELADGMENENRLRAAAYRKFAERIEAAIKREREGA